MKKGIAAFIIVLFLMPLGHALMVLNEVLLPDSKFLGAGAIGFLGLIAVYIGVKQNEKRSLASVLGLLGAVFVWTGWVEFSFVWIAEKLDVLPYVVDGEVATKPEYLVMLSSVGLLFTVILFYLFTRTNCTFFVWIQRIAGLKDGTMSKQKVDRPLSIIAFMESVIIIWFFYIVLLFVYDPEILGDRHPLTYVVAYGSLIWSMYLMAKLLKIKTFDYAIRYAIPTVIIFWNFVEILGRWGMFKEFWVHPFEHWIELSIITLTTTGFIVYFLKSE
ncbi:MAG: hypothetical protein COA58_14760 [Bacteroidetes bacterium]|nr:MAG: hypothetical protein COA58_14760 [Bacteroidota bacterium]